MDPYTLGGMIFSIIVIAMIGGFIILFPLTRQLGSFLQKKLESENGPGQSERAEIAHIRETLVALEAELRALTERQDFTERLLDRGEPERLNDPPTS